MTATTASSCGIRIVRAIHLTDKNSPADIAVQRTEGRPTNVQDIFTMFAKLPGLTLLTAAAMLAANVAHAQDDAQRSPSAPAGQYDRFVDDGGGQYPPRNPHDPSNSGSKPRILTGPTGSSHLNLSNLNNSSNN